MLKRKSYTRITLSLDIIKRIINGKYKGFHELNIIKHMIDLYDTIMIKESPSTVVRCSDPKVPDGEKNLCFKAIKLMKKTFNKKSNVEIFIEKNIPLNSGLAGASSNAATTMKLLNQLWNLGLSKKEMMDLGRTIGMDVPYFFLGGTAYDNEIDKLSKINTSEKLNFIITVPEIGVSTQKAYSMIDYQKIGKDTDKTEKIIEILESGETHNINNFIHNDFEMFIFDKYPVLKKIKQDLLGFGCPAFLTGSGSSIIGIAVDRNHALQTAEKMKCKTIIASSK